MWTLTTSTTVTGDVTSVNIPYPRPVTPRTQPYHHGNLRPVLVDTAVELARSTGPEGVVLREVARRAGVSHNAAYRHFEDRAALLAEVADRAMAQLEDAMQARADAVRARHHLRGGAYVRNVEANRCTKSETGGGRSCVALRTLWQERDDKAEGSHAEPTAVDGKVDAVDRFVLEEKA